MDTRRPSGRTGSGRSPSPPGARRARGRREAAPPVTTVLLLFVSNIFMTFAWYGHLRFRGAALWKAILVSWLIAFAEYCFQVPANRLGYGRFTGAQLKTIQ